MSEARVADCLICIQNAIVLVIVEADDPWNTAPFSGHMELASELVAADTLEADLCDLLAHERTLDDHALARIHRHSPE